jgi:hypothetical protein
VLADPVLPADVAGAVGGTDSAEEADRVDGAEAVETSGPVAAAAGSGEGGAAVGAAAAGGGSAAGGPAGLVTARRARRSRPRPELPFSAADPLPVVAAGPLAEAAWPLPDSAEPAGPLVPADASAGSLFCRSISSIRAISPVRLPGAADLIGPLRATRELFVRVHWSSTRHAGVPRIQARCQYLSLCSVPLVWPGRFRRVSGLTEADGGSVNAQRPLSQSRHQCW